MAPKPPADTEAHSDAPTTTDSDALGAWLAANWGVLADIDPALLALLDPGATAQDG